MFYGLTKKKKGVFLVPVVLFTSDSLMKSNPFWTTPSIRDSTIKGGGPYVLDHKMKRGILTFVLNTERTIVKSLRQNHEF